MVQQDRRVCPDQVRLAESREALTSMAHTRIRKFNTRDTYPEQKLDNDLCQAVVAGGTIYLRGQVGQDLDTGASVAIGDPAGQAEQVMRNIDTLAARMRRERSSTSARSPST